MVSNSRLENIHGLVGLKEAHALIFQNNISLKDSNGLENLKNSEDVLPSITVIGNTSLDDFCSLGILAASEWRAYTARNNFYDPTLEQIEAGECRL